MAGIQSLLQGPQGQQGLAPGQAQQAPLPGMMPKPQGTQPGVPALVPSLVGMDMGQLLQMFADPNNPVPKNRLIAAMTEQQQAAEAKAAVERQMAMAQNAAAPTGTIAQQVVQRAMRAAQPLQMAAHGGIMRGYAGGGAVAFQTAGVVPPGLLNPDVDEEGLPRGKDERQQIIDYNNRVRAAYEQQMKSKAAAPPRPAAPSMQDIAGVMAGRRQLEQFYKPRNPEAYTPEMVSFKVGDAAAATPTAASVPMSMQDTRGGTPEMAALAQMLGSGAAPAPGPSAPPGGQRQAAAPAPAPAPVTGLPALSAERQAEIAADQAKAEKLAADQAAVVERLSRTSPEVLAARENLQRIMGSAYDPQKKTLEEAKDLFARGIGGNAEALGRMAAALGGAKRLGPGLAAAAGAGAEFVGEQRKRVQALQDEYNRLQSQLDITMAQAQYADVIGDDKLKRDALTKAEEIKKSLFDTQRGIRKEAFGEQVQQAQGIAALRDAASRETQARAAMIQAGKPTAQEFAYALFKADPEKYKEFLAAGQEPKSEGAMLKEIVGTVLKNPLMMQQYPPAIQALVSQELLKLGVTSSLPKGAGVRE